MDVAYPYPYASHTLYYAVRFPRPPPKKCAPSLTGDIKPIGYNGTPQIPKLPLSLRQSPSPSSTPIPQPTPLITPNGIRIHSSILPQCTFRTNRHRQTNRWSRRQVSKNTASACYTDRESDVLIMVKLCIWYARV